MTPALVHKLTVPGAVAEFRNGVGARRRGIVVRCSDDGRTLYVRPYARNGYSIYETTVPIPADQVREIRLTESCKTTLILRPERSNESANG